MQINPDKVSQEAEGIREEGPEDSLESKSEHSFRHYLAHNLIFDWIDINIFSYIHI